MGPGDFKKAIEILAAIRPALDREKINDLNKKFGVAVACFAHGLDQLFQSGQKSIVPDAQERPTRNVTHTGRLDY